MQTGLPKLNRHMLVNAVQAEVENIKDLKPDMVEIYLGKDYAPGLYAWLIPKQGAKAKVGLATNTGNPKELLQRFMFKHPVASKKLCEAKILQASFHPITLGGPIPQVCSNGFLAVGDVASQVKPTTGGGVIFGMACARVAAEVIHEALHKNDFSSETLSEYQKRCDKILRFEAKFMLKARRMLDALSDDKIDKVFSLCTRISLDRTLRNFEDIDLQGHSLLRMLWNPRLSVVLLYFLFSYLFANP